MRAIVVDMAVTHWHVITSRYLSLYMLFQLICPVNKPSNNSNVGNTPASHRKREKHFNDTYKETIKVQILGAEL